MEGSEAYDMVKDLEVELYEVIEDDILHTDDIDRNYSIFIDEDIVESNYQELGYLNILKNHDHPHPLEFFSRMFSICTKRSYTYMVLCSQYKTAATSEHILSVEASFAKLNLLLVVAHWDA